MTDKNIKITILTLGYDGDNATGSMLEEQFAAKCEKSDSLTDGSVEYVKDIEKRRKLWRLWKS